MFIKTGDTQLFTASFGRGPQTILAQGGWAGNWELWAEPFEYLSQTWRTVAFDHRGTGATVTPLNSITVDNMVADLFTIINTRNLKHCVLAAESAGATVALLAVLQQPERFSGLVLVDGLIHHPANNEGNPFLQSLRADFDATIDVFVNLCAPEPGAAAVRRWGSQILHRSEPAAAIRLIECMAGIDLHDRLNVVAVPTVVIHGGADQVVPLQDSIAIANAIPSSRLYIIDDAGHVPTMTHGQEVATIIDEFFVS